MPRGLTGTSLDGILRVEARDPPNGSLWDRPTVVQHHPFQPRVIVIIPTSIPVRRVDNARSNAMKKGLSAGRVPKPLVIVFSQTAFSVTIAPPIFAIARGTILAVKEYRLTFVQVRDPFADEELTNVPDDNHLVTPPSTVPTVEDAIPSSTSSTAPPEKDGALTAVLLQHFKECPSQWLDCFDSDAYYSAKIPVMVATQPMLKAAACALAAKHLHRICRGDPTRILQLPHMRNSPLQWTIREMDCRYESVRFYDQTIHYLKAAILLEIPDNQREEIFAVVAILWELSKSPTSALPNSLMHISRSVFWSLVRQDCLSACRFLIISYSSVCRCPISFNPGTVINETQTRLNLSDLVLWRNFGLIISSSGHFLPPSASPAMASPSPSPLAFPLPLPPPAHTWLCEDMLSNALIWIISKIINFITSGDGITPGDFENPRGQRPCFGTTQEELLARWKRLDIELRAWYDTVPRSFTPCARSRLFLSNAVPIPRTASAPAAANVATNTTSTDTIDAIIFTVPMCAVTMQTYHMARVLLLTNMPQESTAIRSTARLRSYRRIAELAVRHAREICGISLGGLPDAILPHTVQPLFVAGQCFEQDSERQLVVDLLQQVECDSGWATKYRIQDLQRQWAETRVG
ncbi:hypothetical protein AnigIFM59636_009707 [Aspergillus niger]|nr:hypothetical protein AnigIFM59636_009707 [Aspergillus niger]